LGFFRNVSFALFLENGIVYLRDLKKRESGEAKPEARLLVIRSVDLKKKTFFFPLKEIESRVFPEINQRSD